MPVRPLVVLAILAALMGAPPTASAASNTLHSPSATPTSGTTSTAFVLRVGYEGRFPALRVEAAVAGETLALTRTSGSSLAGSWETVTQLPPGAWPVIFTATVERGNPPSLPGPILTVVTSTAATPSTSAPSAPAPDHPAAAPAPDHPAPNAGSERTAPTPGSAGEVEPDPAAGAPAVPGETAGPGSGADGGSSPTDPSPADNGSDGSGGSEGSDGSRADDPGATVNDASAARRGSPSPPDGGPAGTGPPTDGALGSAAEDRAGASPDGDAGRVDVLHDPPILAGVVVSGLLLVAGSAVLAATMRRRRTQTDAAEALVVAAQTEALLERRALRRAHVVMPEDPIVASLERREHEHDRRESEPGRRRGGSS